MSKLKDKANDKKKSVIDKIMTNKEGKRIKLGKDIKIILIVIGAVVLMLLFGLFQKLITSSSNSDDTLNPETAYLDSILLGKQTKETSNIDAVKADKNTSKTEEYNLIRVIDGDTIEVKKGENGDATSVRLLSVNTPESVNPDPALNNNYGVQASDFTKNLLNGTEKVYLSFDTEKKDEYGRLLAYVWLTKDANLQSEDDIKGYMLNSILVQNGFAEVMIVEPNHKYQEILEKQEQTAIEQNAGLWADQGYRSLTGKGKNILQNSAINQ